MAELLIALAVLGVIATFTIPKVLNGQQDGKRLAIIKEITAAVSGTYSAYRQEKSATAATTLQDLIPYLNYVKEVTTPVDGVADVINCAFATGRPCSGGVRCLQFANGGILRVPDYSFSGTASTNGIWFWIDWDGKQTATSMNHPSAPIYMNLYYNGRITDWGNITPGTTSSHGSFNPHTGCVPNWYTWN